MSETSVSGERTSGGIERNRAREEVLEALWTEEERGSTRRQDLARVVHVPLTDSLIDDLKAEGLIEERRDGAFAFTPEGRGKARDIIRRHRLAERLVHDILSLPMEEMEANACEYEHVVAPGITESICTLLGHPAECPHGRPIPEGPCCREARRSVESVVIPASGMHIGETARIAYINTKNYARLQKLTAFGVSPGVRVKLHQRRPAFVLECEHTQLAIEESLAKDVFVFRDKEGSG